MDRATWLNKIRRALEVQEDTIYAPIYDEHWGAIDPIHHRLVTQFIALSPPAAHILDAPCGTGKYWPLILASGRTVFGIDQSQGMLSRARAKHPGVPSAKVGLQELDFHNTFDGALCVDTLEMIPPEEWPLVLHNLNRALRAHAYLYFTVEIASEAEIARAFADAQQAGLPTVYGEWAYETGYHGEWAQDGGYHYYPKLDQVRLWYQDAGFTLIEEAVGDEYHHFLVQKAG
jgi:SAM-dependent methyltransferase